MTDATDRLVVRLAGEAPPPSATPLLRAVWHGLRGDWMPQDLAQAQDDVQGAWVRACAGSRADCAGRPQSLRYGTLIVRAGKTRSV